MLNVGSLRPHVIEMWQSLGKESRIIGNGTCMAPLIKDGDLIFIKFVPPSEISAGDIALIDNNGSFLCHRIVSKDSIPKEFVFFEKSDHSVSPHQIAHKDVLGKVIAIQNGNCIININNATWNLINKLFAWQAYQISKLYSSGTLQKHRRLFKKIYLKLVFGIFMIHIFMTKIVYFVLKGISTKKRVSNDGFQQYTT